MKYLLSALCVMIPLLGYSQESAPAPFEPVTAVSEAPVPLAPSDSGTPVSEQKAEAAAVSEPAPLASEPAAISDTSASVPAAPQDAAVAVPAPMQQVALETGAEAGKYERKSVTFVNRLFLLDGSVRNMPSSFSKLILSQIKKDITMERFDYNSLPDAVTADFAEKANAQSYLSIEGIAKILDETLVPKILAIVDLNKELRAQNYTTEAQRNSFYATKAKEFGYTQTELEKIMNSAYIYIPVARNYWSRTSYLNWPFAKKYKARADVGILWYRIITKGEKAQAKLVVNKMTNMRGSAPGTVWLWFGERRYKVDGEKIGGEERAFRYGLKNMGRNLKYASQDIPDFRLSGQVVEKGARSVGFDLGKREGVRVDDKYRLSELEETADGNIVEKTAGWSRVTKVAKADDKKGYVSHAALISGKPSIGMTVSEYPRVPIDIACKLRTFPGVRDSNNLMVFSASLGVQFDARYNIGRSFGWPGLFAAVGYSYGATDRVGVKYREPEYATANSSGYSSARYGGLTFALLQRISYLRYSVLLEAGKASTGMSTTSSGSFRFVNGSKGGLYYGGNLGYQLTPTMAIEAGAVYENAGIKDHMLNDESVEFEYDHSGIAVKAGVIISPQSLWIDPVDFIRSYMGW